MTWETATDAMPWVGVYVCIASLICTLAMAADAFLGFRQRKLWFPCRFFTLNAASITLIAIAMKLPVDLSKDLSEDLDTDAKYVSIMFLVTMIANFLPSLGLMNDNEVVMNIVALGILMITITVNVLIQMTTAPFFWIYVQIPVLVFSVPWPFAVALTVSASRSILQHRYEELNRLDANHQEIHFSCKRLIRYVKKYWMMAETGNPQFAIACSPISSAFGVICSYLAASSVFFLLNLFINRSSIQSGESDYKWSVDKIVSMQSIGIIVGSIAPTFRCLTATRHFNLSARKWGKKHLNVFRVEKQWTQRLRMWKRSHVPSHIPGRHCKKVFYIIRNMSLNFCIALQITCVVMCNTICVIPRSVLILLSCCYWFCKSLLKRFKEAPDASDNDMRSEMEEYSRYVVQTEVEAKLSKRILKNALNSINRLFHESEKKEPSNLIKLLKKSTGFDGVKDLDSDQVPPLHREEIQNCWSLVTVTLTAIALAIPTIARNDVKGLLGGMREGLEFVRHIEESLNENGDLVKARKAGRWVWTDLEVLYRWLQIDLQKKSLREKTSREILQWLGDEAAKIVIQIKRRKNAILDHSLRKFIAASSMYRISQTVLLLCNEKENWPTDDELFEFISTIIADVLCACFTNLPRVITMKCHHDVIEKREESIRTAVQLLGKSKNILKMLEARQLPNLDMESMGYIDKWHALPNSQIPNGSDSSSSNESCIVTIN